MNKNPSKTKYANARLTESVKYLISFVIIAAGVAGFMFLKSLQKPPLTRPSDSLIPLVEVREVIGYAGQLDMEVTGSVVPYREIRVAAEVAGRVTNKSPACEAGQFVQKGELLLEIDPEEYRLDIETQKANLEQAKRRIEENLQLIDGEKKNIELAASDLQLQRDEWQRNQRLKDALSRSELDRSRRAVIAAESALTLRRNNLASLESAETRLEAALEVAKRQLEKAELNLRRATVVAPETGVIVSEMVQEGDYVGRGTQLLIFEDTRRAEVLCNLTMSELNQIRKNAAAAQTGNESLESNTTSESDLSAVYRLPKTPVTIFDPANPDVQWSGVLERFDGIGVDSVTKTIPCRIAVDNPIAEGANGSYALVRGMFVRCLLEFHASSGNSESRYLALPEQAVQPNRHVWTVQDSRLKKKSIKVVDYVNTELGQPSNPSRSNSRLAIIAKTDVGPDKGDLVVVSPLSQPSDDVEVEISNPDATKKPPESAADSSDSDSNESREERQ
jgi:multidrug efflux pump subunit AcrA (membrane-fusion protein)